VRQKTANGSVIDIVLGWQPHSNLKSQSLWSFPMRKIISGLLTLSSLALATVIPLSVKAMPLPPQGGTLIAGWGHGHHHPHHRPGFHRFHNRRFHDHPFDNYYQVYDLFCRRNDDHDWERVNTYNHRSQAIRAEEDYQERGYRCRVSSRNVSYRN
jgi:hypothetical protein